MSVVSIRIYPGDPTPEAQPWGCQGHGEVVAPGPILNHDDPCPKALGDGICASKGKRYHVRTPGRLFQTIEYTAEDVLGEDEEKVRLSRALVISSVPLREANLYGANLYGANLYEADLCGADLCGANLYGANLYEADLREADLRGANLYGANLRRANLYGANLYEADLRGADLCEANLREANLYGAKRS